MLPDQRNDDVRALGACAQHEHRMAVLVDLQLRKPHVGVRRLAERDDAGRRVITHAHDARVVAVEDCEAVLRQCLDELPLRDGDVVLASELPDVGDTHVEDEADRRSDHGREVADVATPTSPHLGDEVGRRLPHAEGCQGRADLVVERAGRCDRLARALEQLGDDVLRAGLALRTRDADDPKAREARHHHRREVGQGRHRVLDDDGRNADRPLTRAAAAPAATQAAAKSWPSTRSPRIATKSPPATTWRESWKTSPTTSTVPSPASASSPSTASAISARVIGIIRSPP